MSVRTVYDALNRFLSGGTIDLWTASADPELSRVRGVLTLFGISQSYTVTNAVLTEGLDNVTLAGAGIFGQPGDPQGMRFAATDTLIYQQSGADDGVFTFSIRIRDPGWTFSDFFNGGALPPSQRYDDTDVSVIWGESFLVGLRLDAVVFSGTSLPGASLTLSGLLPENERVFGPFISMMAPWPLELTGTLIMPLAWTDPPVMTLVARAAGGAKLSIDQQPDLPDGPAALALTDLGFQLLVRTDLDPIAWGRTAFSVLNLIGTVSLGTPPNALIAYLTTQVLTAQNDWHLQAQFDPAHASIVRGMAQLTTIFGLPALPLPDNFPLIDTFKFRSVELFVSDPIKNPRLRYLVVTIGSDIEWTPPVPFVTIHNLGTSWTWGWTKIIDESGQTRTTSTVSGSVFGSFRFGSDTDGGDGDGGPPPPDGGGNNGGGTDVAVVAGTDVAVVANKVDIDVSVTLPDLFINGQMRRGDVIPIGPAFKYFFGAFGPNVGGDKQAYITELGFSADPLGQSYSAETAIVFTTDGSDDPSPGWAINLFVITVVLHELRFWIQVLAGRVGGGISGELSLGPPKPPDDYEAPRLMLSAEYPVQDPETKVGWTFTGHLYEGTSIDLTLLVAQFLGFERAPDSVPKLTVDRLDFTFTTGSKAYELGGTMSVRWTPKIFDTDLLISAAASIDVARPAEPPQAPAQGRLRGKFAINRISVEAAMDVGVKEKTYLFKVMFDNFWLQAVTSWRGVDPKRHQAISLQLGGVTVGDVLEYLVNLAAPTIGFELDAPWDMLKRIDLSRFMLTLDPTDNVVEFIYQADVDLGFGRLSKIGVRYKKGGAGKVDLILEGNFLGKSYKGDDALAWDVVNDPPPAMPGTGKALVDLRYLGIGQRIALRDPPASIAASLALLKKFMEPVDDPKKLPSRDGEIAFSADSQWLIGLDVGLMSGTIDLGLIFNDPVLYGLSIALSGEKAGPLAGLRFEILYKKITNDIGMFRVELRIPDAFRTFQIGVASITLGTVVVEIYTNGNFRVDLGFPHNQDFSRSFSLQAYIFIGRGGLYFAVLNGATSSRVPRITNGNFAPVLELGIGISAGVGREIRAGVLAGGAYVELQVIFEGVLGWFEPTSAGTAPAKYFRAQGIVALHGKVYGYVDFKIIKVSIVLEAYASVSALFESYRPTIFRLDVWVRAEASVKIIFFTISFSFGLRLELTFTVGTTQQTPWVLAADQGGAALEGPALRLPSRGTGGALRLRRNRALRHATLRRHYLRTTKRAAAEPAALGETWGWNPGKKLFPDGKYRTALLHLLPIVSLGDVPVSWKVTPPPDLPPHYRAAFVLCADSGVDPRATTAARTRVRSAKLHPFAQDGDDTEALTADLWVKVFLLYALYSIPGGPTDEDSPVTAGQLALLAAVLDAPGTANAGFAMSKLDTLFDTNLHLLLAGDPKRAPDAVAADVGGMVAPLPPGLSWTATPGGNTNFATINQVGPWYEWDVARVLGKYFPVGGATGERPEIDQPYESFPTYVFRDFCLMITKAAVEQAQQLMTAASATVAKNASGEPQTLAEIAGGFPSATIDYAVRAGDTVTSVAQAIGATTAEILFLNPGFETVLAAAPVGSTVPVKLGIAPEVLAEDNPETAFALARVALGTVPHQVADGETLNSIAALFNQQNVASLFAQTELGASAALLRVNATFAMTAQSWTGGPDSLLRAAATAFARYTMPGLAPAPWYAQAVFDLNRDLLATLYPSQQIPTVVELPPGQLLKVPLAFNVVDPTVPPTYATVAGDTLERIGIALSLEQVYPNVSPPEAPTWQSFKGQVTSPSSGTYSLPAWTGLFVLPGESVEALARRLIVSASWTGTHPGQPSLGNWTYDWPAIVQWAGPAAFLSPLAVVPVPGAVAAASEGVSLSFAVLAKRFGMAIPDAAERLANTAGLYALGTELKVTHLPVMTVKQLADGVLTGERLPRVVNQASRNLMAGLRLPALEVVDGHTVPSPTQTKPLYDLTGQQLDLQVDTDPSHGPDVALTLSVSSQTSWITFSQSDVVRAGEDRNALAARHPEALNRNAGLAARDALPAGMVVLTADTPTLDYSYTNAQIIAMGPATKYTIPVAQGPAPLPLGGLAPRSYGLDHRIELQTPVALPIPGADSAPLSGQPSLWPFSGALRARAIAGATNAYEILATRQEEMAGRHAGAVTDSTWAGVLSITLKQVGASLSLFTLQGVDEADRAILLALRSWLLGVPPAGTVAHVLVQPSPNAGNADGLGVLGGTPTDTYIIKSNLSTDTVPQPPAAVARAAPGSPPGSSFASLADLVNFVTLLWEGSVVGGVGYYLGFNQKLPASSIDGNGRATVQLLVIASTQQAKAPQGRPLLPFNNCALIGPGLDAAVASVYVEDYGDGDMVRQALVPPGSNGFTLALVATPETINPTPDERLKQLFSLLSFSIPKGGGSPFDLPPSGMPVPPTPSPKDNQPAWQRERLLRRRLMADPDDALDPQPWWRYDQVLPLYRFAPASPLPRTAGLPSPDDDPYRGFGIASALPTADFTFGFGDLLGNRTAPPPAGEGILAAPTGYTDPLIGVTDWPAVVGYYGVASSGAQASLTVVLEPRGATVMPSPSQLGAAAADAATRQAEAYGKSYYQLGQISPTAGQTVQGRVVTSLQVDDAPTLAFDVTRLWRYAAAAYAFAATAAKLRNQPAAGGSTLDDMIATYHVRPAEIALAHEEFPVQALFGTGPLTVHAYAAFLEHDTAQSIAAMPRPPGWPTPSALAILSDPNNGVLPLKVGAVLRVDPPRSVSTGDGTSSLRDLAAANGTTPALLATDNPDAAVLAQGFEFEVAVADDTYVVVTVTAPGVLEPIDSFAKVCAEFVKNGVNVTPADIAELAADKPGIFQAGKTLSSKVWVAAADETLSQNGSGRDQAALAAHNQATPDLFDIGALVMLGTFGGTNGVPPPQDQTLRQFADAYACPPELIITANLLVALPSDTGFAVPGLVAWPDSPAACRVPYSLQAGDSLNAVASRFAWPAGDAPLLLAEANQNMPGALKGNVTLTVTVGGQPVVITTPAGGQSLAGALAQVQATAPAATLADVVNSIGGRTDVLADDALLICAPARLSSDTSPAGIAPLYRVSAAALAQANAGTPGIIAAGLTLYGPDGVSSVATQSNDTFNTLVVRFAAQGVQVDAGQIAAALGNRNTALFKAGALMLLPPAPATIKVPLSKDGPYPGALFPLSVALRLTRPHDLINPFFGSGGLNPVEQVESVIPAPLKSAGKDGQGSLTFDAFIADMRNALPNLRVATGRAPYTPQDLWGVNFDAKGISSVRVFGGTTVPGEQNPQPRFFALEPLYRTLVTRSGVPIQPLGEDGALGTAVPTDFQGIDVEPWAARFLADMDRFLSAANAARVYGDATARQSLKNVIASKALLTTAIPAGLGVVLAITDPKASDGLTVAAKALTQQLGVSLARAYATSTIVQFDRTVTSPWQTSLPGLEPAELYGQLGLGTEGALQRSWTTTAGKCWLDDSNPFVTLLMTESDPASHRSVTAEMTFDISELEHNITPAGLPDGYVASNWLSFVPRLKGKDRPPALHTDLGKVSIPIPLRNFPALPIVMAQAARASTPLPPEAATRARRRRTMRTESSVALGDMPLWDHSFNYSHEHAEQDDVTLTLQYNLRKPTDLPAAVEPRDLFTELAQYIAVAAPLWAILDRLADGSGGLTPTERNAVGAFDTLADRVARYWGTRIAGNAARGLGDSAEAVPEASFHLRARVTDRDSLEGGREVDSLTLTRLDAQPGPNGNWPVLHARTVSGEEIELETEAVPPTQMRYRVPAGASVPSSWPVFTLTWERLSVEAWQNATGAVNVERNQKLLGDNGPNTNPAFVFQTETVKAASIVTPLNQWSERVRLVGTAGPDYIASALNKAFSTLFPQAMAGGPTQRISMAVSYAYELSLDPLDPTRALISTTPVYLYPDHPLDTQTAGVVQGAAEHWEGIAHPIVDGGEWVFSLTLYSSLESEQRPLLLIDNLFLPLAPPTP